jgi:hypothetical protein
MLPAAISEDEVVEPVGEFLASDGDAEAACISEVRPEFAVSRKRLGKAM